MEIVDVSKWKRKDYYEFFSNYINPYMGFVFKLDITNIIEELEKNKKSFYGIMTYLSLKSMNDIEEFKYTYRMNEKLTYDKVICKYDNLIVSNTILKGDNSFNFTDYISYDEDINVFIDSFELAKKNALNNTKTRKFIDGAPIYISCLPWFDFVGYYDAYMGNGCESSPKICWGKYFNENGCYYIHYSISVNHAFQDGFHIGEFYNNLQENIKNLKLSQGKGYLKNEKASVY